jgi:hypothetical protein
MSNFYSDSTDKEFSSSSETSTVNIGNEYLASRIDKSEEFIQIVNNKLLPIITKLFEQFVPKDFIEPTRYLDNKFKEEFGEESEKKHDIEVLEIGFNSYYKIGKIGEEDDYMIVIKLNQSCFTLSIVPNDQYDYNSQETNYIAFSPERKYNMYIYGVKANGDGPKISGNVFNKAAFDICKAMRIPELFISDSAGIPCYWNENIELKHFSILRVMVGKPTFYESMPGHFLNPVSEEKQFIYNAITEEERTIIKEYLNSLKEPKDPSKTDVCNQINAIIHKVSKDSSGNDKNLEIYKYVATPYVAAKEGGKRKTKRGKTRKGKTRKGKTRRNNKIKK